MTRAEDKPIPERIWIAGFGIITGMDGPQGYYRTVKPKYDSCPEYVPAARITELDAKIKQLESQRSLLRTILEQNKAKLARAKGGFGNNQQKLRWNQVGA